MGLHPKFHNVCYTILKYVPAHLFLMVICICTSVCMFVIQYCWYLLRQILYLFLNAFVGHLRRFYCCLFHPEGVPLRRIENKTHLYISLVKGLRLAD